MYKLEIPGPSMAVASSMWGPKLNSINLQSRFCELMPLAPPIGSKLSIYAALADIPPRPDGGLPRPTPSAPQPALARPRWLHLFLDENLPLPLLAILCTLRPGHVTATPDLTAETTIPAE
jgi:hypothetical protein